MTDVQAIPFYELDRPVRDTVWDDLTMTQAKVVRIEVNEGQTCGIWLDNEYDGGRHPWEISLLPA